MFLIKYPDSSAFLTDIPKKGFYEFIPPKIKKNADSLCITNDGHKRLQSKFQLPGCRHSEKL